MKSHSVAVILTAAFLLSACGAQPADLPTVTPLQLPSTATTVAPTTEQTTPASPQSSTERPLAKLQPAQRTSVGTQPPPMTIDPTKKYLATISTDKGNIVVELDPTAAPQTVNNFVYLAQNGFYDGLTFHRVEPSFVIQGGDPAGNGTGGPGYNIPPEIKLTHVDGAIAMARQSGPADTTPSSGSQFYITIGAQPNLDTQYTVFGKTVSGQDVVRKIAVGDVIKRIDISEPDGSAISAVPTMTPVPATCEANPLNPVADDHVLGKTDAPVTIIEYADMQCPACGELHPSLKSVFAQISDTVQLVYRHFPLTSIHDKAQITSQAIEAAGLQNKFWELHDLLYEKQSEWSSVPVTNIVATLKGYAQGLGMDAARFETDLNSQAVVDRVNRDTQAALALQLNATPSMFLNGRQVNPSAFTQPTIAEQIRVYAEQRAEITSGAKAATLNVAKPEQVTEAGATYMMTLKTSKGDIQIELDPKLAPLNVNSTIYLAQQGYFDNSPLELNDKTLGALLFGNSSRTGNPGYSCSVELPAVNSYTQPGVVALLSDMTHNTTQLIITYSATQQFESQFSVIGHVTTGLEIAKSLQATEGITLGDKIVSTSVVKK